MAKTGRKVGQYGAARLKVTKEAESIAQRLASYQATAAELAKEYQCNCAVFRAGLIDAIGEQRYKQICKRGLRPGQIREPVIAAQVSDEDIARGITELKNPPKLKTVWICRGCREQYKDRPDRCPNCSNTFFESARAFIEEKHDGEE